MVYSYCSVQFSRSDMSNSLRPYGLQHTRLPCPSPTLGACSNSCPSSQWCHPTISSSVMPFSSCQVLGWCKNNCDFTLLNIDIWHWNTFLNKGTYVTHHFNVHFSLYVSWNDITCCLLLLFSHSVVSNSLQPHGLQHTRLPSPSLLIITPVIILYLF